VKPEQAARGDIDRLLEAAGWKVQNLRQINQGGARGVAVREFPLHSGAADYLLFVDRAAVGVIEAVGREAVDLRFTHQPAFHAEDQSAAF